MIYSEDTEWTKPNCELLDEFSWMPSRFYKLIFLLSYYLLFLLHILLQINMKLLPVQGSNLDMLKSLLFFMLSESGCRYYIFICLPHCLLLLFPAFGHSYNSSCLLWYYFCWPSCLQVCNPQIELAFTSLPHLSNIMKILSCTCLLEWYFLVLLWLLFFLIFKAMLCKWCS